MISRWPAIRTLPDHAAGHTSAVVWAGAMGVLLIPLLLSLGLGVTGWLLNNLTGFDRLAVGLRDMALILMMTPFLSFFGILAAVPTAIFALRRGVAGWLCAVLAGGVVGFVVFAVVTKDIKTGVLWLGLITGCPFGGLFWLSGRLARPSVFEVS